MTPEPDLTASVEWPAAGYVDDEGIRHAWTDTPPDEDGSVDPDSGYTYMDMVVDQAEAQGMTVAEFLVLDEVEDEDEDEPWGYAEDEQ